jgi:hypothetical protein
VAVATPKAVLDTQIIVRGLVRRRKSAAVELLDLALEGLRIVALTSPAGPWSTSASASSWYRGVQGHR